jgi:hypothetical protein
MSPFEEDPGNAKAPAREKAAPSGWGRAAVCIVALLSLVYLFYSNSQFKKEMRSEMARLEDRVQALKESGSLAEASLSGQILGLKEEIDAVRASSPPR